MKGMWTMKGKIGIVAIVGLLMAIVFVSGCTDQNTNQTNTSNTTNTTNTSTIKEVDVKATMNGPSTGKKGTSVLINCSIINKGSTSIKNVIAHSQDFDRNLGIFGPGQTKSFTWNVYIPTDKEVQEDFGENATVSNPFYIGGFGVTFTDSSGSKNTVNSNNLNIKLS